MGDIALPATGRTIPPVPGRAASGRPTAGEERDTHMRSRRFVRPVLAGWALGMLIAALNVAVAFADGGWPPFPR